MKKKLFVLGIALMGVAGALCVQPRNVEASSCVTTCSGNCCQRCCTTSTGAVICTNPC